MTRSAHIFHFTAAAIIFFAVGTHAQVSTKFIVLHQASASPSFTSKQTRVIASQEEYASVLAAYSDEQPHQPDFNSGRVLLLDMGIRPTGGYAIEAMFVDDKIKGAVRVNVRLTKPGPGCLTEQAFSNPFQFIYVPTRKEILVTESLRILDCRTLRVD